MKLKQKILFGTVAVLATLSLGRVTAQTAQAQNITIHQGQGRHITPYVKHKGKFTYANQDIRVKSYKFYGQPI